MKNTKVTYDDRIVRWFMTASVLWGIVGMLVGVIVALQLAFWQADIPPFLNFGRLRPLHTNAVIFAFVGNMMFAGVYYSTQRLLKARMGHDLLSKIHFWAWQLIIVSAALTLPLGITTGKEYAELEWPIDLAITLVWVVFAVNFFWTVFKRNEKHLYVALWFYIATLITIAVLHITNSLELPVSAFKSYSIWAGVQDALVQWWYGHNAVAFFLTTPMLGIMYYFVPKAAERPVYSYRLSVIHFWSLVFLYIWAGPHHLLYTALPDWAQTLGMIFSVMLWAPSWGGMINGLLTLRGGWEKLRDDPVLKFFAASVTFYGMSTFEGPLLSVKSVNGLAHYTDWIIGHVHSGALGWNGFLAAGMFYWLAPRLWGTKKLYSVPAANAHFYLGTFGILLYMASMWISGITQGLMWRAQGEGGGLAYPSFVETIMALRPMYYTRIVGGALYLVGFVICAWNLWKTAKSGAPVDTTVEVATEAKSAAEPSWIAVALGKPVLLSIVVTVLACSVAFLPPAVSVAVIVVTVGLTVVGGMGFKRARVGGGAASWHHVLEGRALPFTVVVVLAVVAGGIAEIVPTVLTSHAGIATSANKPYSPLQLEGRDVYIQEGCYVCHSQMVRTFTWEVQRYGKASTIDDSIFDHPFQWGSKRTGPDLAHEGGMRSNVWHFQHMMDPRSITPGSNMPPYAFLTSSKVNFAKTATKVRAMKTLGVPYADGDVAGAEESARAEGEKIAAGLKRETGTDVAADSQMTALIAFLQRLGRVPESPKTAALDASAAAGGG